MLNFKQLVHKLAVVVLVRLLTQVSPVLDISNKLLSIANLPAAAQNYTPRGLIGFNVDSRMNGMNGGFVGSFNSKS